MSTYYPYCQTPIIAPYHAKQPMPLPDIKSWIRTAQPGQSFIVRDGPISALPRAYKLWLEVWEDEGFITYKAVKASPAALSSHPNSWRVHVTRTGKEL